MGLVGYEGSGCLIEGQVGMTPRSKKYTLKSKQTKKNQKKKQLTIWPEMEK